MGILLRCTCFSSSSVGSRSSDGRLGVDVWERGLQLSLLGTLSWASCVVECGFPVVFCPEGPGGPVHPPHHVTGGGTESEVRPPHPLSARFGDQVRLFVSAKSYVGETHWYPTLATFFWRDEVSPWMIDSSSGRDLQYSLDSMSSGDLDQSQVCVFIENHRTSGMRILGSKKANMAKQKKKQFTHRRHHYNPLRPTDQLTNDVLALSTPSARTNRHGVNTLQLTIFRDSDLVTRTI